MTNHEQPPEEADFSADTATFRVFVEGEESAPVRPVGVPFRLITLVVGLVVFAGLVYLLFKL